MKKGLIIGLIIAIVMTAAGCGNTSSAHVATVAGEKITKEDFNFFLRVAKSSMEGTAGINDVNAAQAFWKDKSKVDTLKKNALDQAKQFKIQLIKANEKKIKADETKVKEEMDNVVKQTGSKQKAEQEIKERFGLTYDQYTDWVRKYIIIQEFATQNRTDLQSKIKITDADIEKNYNDNKAKYNLATVQHILFMTKDMNTNQPLPADKQEEAKKKAEDTLAKAKAGKDFGALAKELSEDPGSKDKGGEYEFPKGQMVKEFEEWSFDSKRKAGDMDIVKTDYGYHVIKFTKLQQKTLADVKEQIKSDLTNSKLQEDIMKQQDEWTKDAKYDVQINKGVYDTYDVSSIIGAKK